MSFQVVLGVGNAAVGTEVRALLEESGEFRVLETARSAPDLVAAAARRDPDVVLLHEDLGPLPVLDLAASSASATPRWRWCWPSATAARPPTAPPWRSASAA